MANRASTRNMQTIRFVIDADASVAPFVYTVGQDVEICEIRTTTTAAHNEHGSSHRDAAHAARPRSRGGAERAEAAPDLRR